MRTYRWNRRFADESMRQARDAYRRSAMPHRRKKSRKEGQPPKDKAANRRKAKQDPIAAQAQAQEDWPTARSKQTRKTAGGKRKRSGPAKKRGKKTAAAKKPTRRSAKAP